MMFGPYGQFRGLFHFLRWWLFSFLVFSIVVERCEMVAGHIPGVIK